MTDFAPVAVRKAGREDRLALNPVALVQAEHDGWVAQRPASPTVLAVAASPEAAEAAKAAKAAAAKANQSNADS